MPLLKPDAEDVRKLHGEINQINHQRFLLTTGAITIFGVLLAWMLKETPQLGAPVNAFMFVLSMILSFILLALYVVNHMLRIAARTYAIYLVETESSNYETDLPKFRPRFVYQGPQTIIFLVLNFLANIFPYLVLGIYSLPIPTYTLVISTIGIGLLVETLIFLMGFCHLWENEDKLRQRLKRLKTP